MPTSWTDNPAVAGSTPIKAVHINEIRSAVNSLRQAAKLHQIGWTDNPIVSGSTPIKSAHFNQLWGAIQDLWFRRGMGNLPSWSAGSVPSTQRTIRASDVNNLRQWVNAYESSTKNDDPQGIVTLSYDPNQAIITQAWVDDVKDIGSRLPHPDVQTKLLVRTNIRANSSNNELPTSNFRTAMSLWNNNGFDVGAVITTEFLNWDKIPREPGEPASYYWPNQELDQYDQSGRLGLANRYILNFAARAANFAQDMAAYGLTKYWIWNEPDADGIIPPGNTFDSPGSLAPEVFRSLLYQTASAIRAVVPNATLYLGSLQVPYFTGDPHSKVDTAASFLSQMYDYLNSHGISPVSPSIGYGWDALSINIEGLFDSTYPQYIHDTLTPVITEGNDKPSLIVGEWGVQNRRKAPNKPEDEIWSIGSDRVRDTYLGIRDYFPTMYFYCHHWTVQDFGPFGTMDPGYNPGGGVEARNYNPSTGLYIVGPRVNPSGQIIKWYDELRNYLYPIP